MRRLADGEMTAASVARYRRVLMAFVRFLTAHGYPDLASADSRVCERFVRAPQATGEPPAASTSRFRLTVVRDAYIALRSAGNPTDEMCVHQTPQHRRSFPLTPAEAARLRSSGRTSPRDQLRPAAVELALRGASHAEIAHVVVADVQLLERRVLIGSRFADLDAFGTATLSARVAACRRAARRREAAWDPQRTSIAMTRPFDTYPATSIAPGISSSLSRALDRAGIRRPGVRASSIRDYAANRAYALTNRAEDVALLLGLGSLDAAMGYVDTEWQATFGEEVRG